MSCFLMASKMDSPPPRAGSQAWRAHASTGWCLGNRRPFAEASASGARVLRSLRSRRDSTWYTSLVALSSSSSVKRSTKSAGAPALTSSRTKGANIRSLTSSAIISSRSSHSSSCLSSSALRVTRYGQAPRIFQPPNSWSRWLAISSSTGRKACDPPPAPPSRPSASSACASTSTGIHLATVDGMATTAYDVAPSSSPRSLTARPMERDCKNGKGCPGSSLMGVSRSSSSWVK
mmetsp:Transcript_7624/g.27671  ORF Transcript_7624/g.27671 Transcript_7624/m.27671 type:complete len:233 (-) Transcript_7624:975-1673(-)